MKVRMCKRCGKRPARVFSELCGDCWYASNYAYTMDQDPDSRDWEWSVCEECGSSLDSHGECRNTSCGNSPYQGEDWE